MVVLPGGLNAYYLTKLAVAAIAILAAALAPATGRIPRSIVGVIAAGALVLVVAALVSASPVSALLGRWPRYEGLVALPVYVGLLWSGARLLGPTAAAARGFFLRALAVVSILIAVVYLVEATGARPIAGEQADRTGSLLGNATDAGLVGAILLVLLGAAVIARPGWLTGLGALGAFATVVLSASRAGLLAAGIAFGVLVVVLVVRVIRGRDRRDVRLLALVAGVPALLAAVALLAPPTAARLTGSTELARSTVENRFLAWGETLTMLEGRWPLGVGPSGFVEGILPFQDAYWARDVGFETSIDSPHNIILQAASAGGLALLVVAAVGAVLVALAVRRSLSAADGRSLPDLLIAVAPVAALAGVASGLLTHFTTMSVLALALPVQGWVIARPLAPGSEPTLVAARRAWVVSAVALAVVLVPAASAELPLRAARDAAASADIPGLEQATAVVRALRPWDADALSIIAQSAAEGAEGVESVAGDTARTALAALAIEYGVEARSRLGGSAAPTLAAAVGYSVTGQNAEALPLLDELVGNSPFDARLYVRRGVALALTGSLEAARADFARALELDPTNEDAARNLAIVEGAS